MEPCPLSSREGGSDPVSRAANDNSRPTRQRGKIALVVGARILLLGVVTAPLWRALF